MDCPRCGERLDRYRQGEREAASCPGCGWTGVSVDHLPRESVACEVVLTAGDRSLVDVTQRHPPAVLGRRVSQQARNSADVLNQNFRPQSPGFGAAKTWCPA